MHLQELNFSLNSMLGNKLQPINQHLLKSIQTNLKDSHFIKSWKQLPGQRSLFIFYHYQTRSFCGILQTHNEFECIPSTRNGFELIKVPLLQDPVIREKIVNSQHPLSSPQDVVAFFKSQLRYPIIKQTVDGYTIQLNNAGLLGGGAQVSSIGTTVDAGRYKDSDIKKEEYRQIVKFLIDRYQITDYELDNSSDRQLVSELAKAICWLKPMGQQVNIKKYLNTYIDAFEEIFFQDQMLSDRVKSLVSESLLPIASKHYCSQNLYLELVKKGYFSKERARGGVERDIIEKILMKMKEKLQAFAIDSSPEDKKKNEEVRLMVLALNRKDSIQEILKPLSGPQVKEITDLVRDWLCLKSEDSQEIILDLCYRKAISEHFFSGYINREEYIPLVSIKDVLNQNFPYSNLYEPVNLAFYLSKIRLNVLSELNLLDHNLSTLVELYNILNSDAAADMDNVTSKRFSKDFALSEIKNTLKSVVRAYRENESNLESGELKSLLSIAFVQDVELFRAFLEAFLGDLSSDILFDPTKVRILSFILISAMRNNNFSDYCKVDDLLKCFSLLTPLIQDLSITSENVNIQEAISSMNDILFLMGFTGATGIKAECLQIVTDLTKYMQTHVLETAYNAITGTAKDPSLDIKREYALEAMKRIESTGFEKWEQRAGQLYQVGQIIGDMTSIGGALLQIKDLLIKSYYKDMPRIWYDDVNNLRFLESEPIKNVMEEIFKLDREPNKNYTFFAAELLLKLITQPHRKLLDKKTAVQALWFLTNGYDYKQSIEQSSAIPSKTHRFNADIHLFVKQSLNKLIQNVDNDLSLYIRKTVDGPLKIESGIGFIKTNLAATLKQYDKSVLQNVQDDPGKQFYITTLSQMRPKLYAIARIQEYSQKTFEEPAIMIQFKGIEKDKDFDDAFMKKIEERVNKITSTEVDEALKSLEAFNFKNKNTATKDVFEEFFDKICVLEGNFDPEKEFTAKEKIMEAAKKVIQNIMQANSANLLDTFNDFLNNPNKQVFLIQGEAGAGKTLLMRLFENRLWGNYNILAKADSKNRNRLPIRIVLSEVKSFNTAIEDVLLQYGCDVNGIEEIKKEPAVILFDGYDEINQYINLYNLNRLETWADVKVIFTSRKENLSSLKDDYLSCFTPENDKSRVLSYTVQPIDEDQINKYFADQKDAKMQSIKRLKHQLFDFNAIDSHFMPISNILIRKAEFVKRLASGGRDKCLREMLATFKKQLPEMEVYDAELKKLGIDPTETTTLTGILKSHIEQLAKVTGKDNQKEILKTLTGDELEKVKIAEKSIKNLKAEASENRTSETGTKIFDNKKDAFYNSKQKGPGIIKFIQKLVKNLKGSISFKTVKQTLSQILENVEDGCRICVEELELSDQGGLDNKERKLAEFKSAFDNEIENLKNSVKYITDFKSYFNKPEMNSIDHTQRKEIETKLNTSEIQTAINEIEKLNGQIYENLAQCLNLEGRIYGLIKPQREQPPQRDQNLGLAMTIDSAEMKGIWEKLLSHFNVIKKHVRVGQNLNMMSFSFPDFQDYQVLAPVINSEPFMQYDEAVQAITAAQKKIYGLSIGPIEYLTRLLEDFIGKVTNVYYVTQMHSPAKTLLDQVEQAQTAKKEFKFIKSLQTKGGFEIVRALQQKSEIIRASKPEAESLMQKINQMVQEIKVLENEFKAIKDDYTEESLMIKSIRKQIQDLTKFTDPQHLGEILIKFKSIIKSPFILRMLTETLVKFPEVSSANKAELYSLYVSMHFEREKEKMLQTERIPPKFNILDSFYQFSKDLATNMFLRNIVSLRAQNYGYKVGGYRGQTDDIWSGFFDDGNEIIRLARRGVQIVEEEGNVRFVHKSILEYFAARQFYDEVLEYNPETLTDFEPYLNKKSIIDNETAIYQLMRDMVMSDKGKKDTNDKNATRFEKQVKEMLSNPSLLRKFEDFNQHALYPNIFLLSLACPEVLSTLASVKEFTFVSVIQKLFEWIFTSSEASFNFFQALERLLEDDKDLYAKIRPLVMFYYDYASKQRNGPQFKDRFITAQRNIQVKVNLTTSLSHSKIPYIKDMAKWGISDQREFSCTLSGKFFIHDSLDSIVVLQTSINGKYFGLDLNPTVKDRVNAVLIDSANPWAVTECKWILKLNGQSHDVFQLRSLADPSQILYGKVTNPEEYAQLFEDICLSGVVKSAPGVVFKCVTCGVDSICKSCTKKCHEGHRTIQSDKKSAECSCSSSECCKLVLCMARSQNTKSINNMYRCSQCPNDEKNRIVCLGCTKHHQNEDHSNFIKVQRTEGCGCNCESRKSRILRVFQEEKETEREY